jgi:CheY-like chemotaxis protein
VDSEIPPTLLGDEFRIKQVILNLLSNAVKFTENGRVSLDIVCSEKADDGCLLTFSITDTGIGMSEEFLGKIFTPFEQEDSFLSRRHVGTGLGLSISHNLVELMGGEMKVESKAGEGSRFAFSILFGYTAELPQSLILKEGDTQEDISLAGKRLLLVDDVEINRMIVCELLENSGVEIDQADDGQKAFDTFMQASLYYYDCILMDIQMPNINGYKATQLIRGSGREDSNIPIIAMTANALKEDVDAALKAGMNDHLAKPIDFGLCISTIKKYCGSKDKNR